MNREKRQRYLLIAAGVGLTTLLVAGFVFLLSQRGEHDRTLMEFEALQAAAALTEYYARSGPPDESVLPERVRGFGIYDDSGRARIQVGTAPAARQPIPPSAAPRSELYRGEGTLRLVRPLGVPRATRPGPMDRMPGNMRERMQDRGMGPRGGMMQPPEPTPNPAPGPESRSALGGATFLLIDYDVSHILASTRTRLASWSALGLALIGLLAAVAALSHRLHLYEEDRRKREHLVQLGEAARTLAHEIRNPLGAMRLQTAMLRKRLGGTDAAAGSAGALSAAPQLDILDEEVGRIDALVNEVREFLQDPTGAPENIELTEFLQSLPTRYSFPIEVELHCPSPCTVRLDRHRLHSVLGNVLRNAAEAAPPVELSLRRTRDSAEIRVADRGPGLPADAAGEHVFDPFYTRKEGGFGVGLAVSKRFVEAAGGSIALRNRDDGAGAECIIHLPEVPPDARADR
jgi:signal transduction histidine kinase